MQKMNIPSLISIIVIAMNLVSGCTSAAEDSSKINCSIYTQTFFDKPTSVQMLEFGNLELNHQYEVYICGNQKREPPAIHLAIAFAKGGKPVANVLRKKLVSARGDLTITDILLVFEEMSILKTYNVAQDKELMTVIKAAVDRVQDPFWKNTCSHSLIEIQKKFGLKSRLATKF
jgi:hypothetical protein